MKQRNTIATLQDDLDRVNLERRKLSLELLEMDAWAPGDQFGRRYQLTAGGWTMSPVCNASEMAAVLDTLATLYHEQAAQLERRERGEE